MKAQMFVFLGMALQAFISSVLLSLNMTSPTGLAVAGVIFSIVGLVLWAVL